MIPKLRFSQFKDDLNSTKFANTADKTVKRSITGGPFGSDLKSEDYTETGVRIIQLQNIGDGIFIDKSKIYTSNEKADTLSACNIFAGELILSKMGDPVARACKMPLQDHRYLMSSDGIRYVPDESLVDKEFIYQYINSSRFRKQAEALSTGSTRKRIGLSDLKNIDIRFPSLAEQRKLSGLLLNLDQKINLLTKKKEALETYKKGLMQKIFSQELRFKREDGTDYPKWERLEIIDILDYEQPTKYIVDSTEYSDDYTTPVLTAGKSFILGYTDEEHNHFTNYPVIIFDDFTTDFKYVDFGFKVKSSAMKILRPKKNVNVRFVYDAMKTIRFPKGEHKRYWISEYSFMKIPYPSKEEQQRIESLSEKFDHKIDLVDKELSSTQKLKKGLLQQMFT